MSKLFPRTALWSRRLRAALAVLATAVAMCGVVLAATSTPSSAATCNGYVGLTFDDGPTGSTSALLNVLRSNGVRATMFNVGQNVQNNRSAAQAQVAAGMWVGNHSWNHAHMTSMSQAQMQSDLSQTSSAIQSATGSRPVLFRPPYGETNSTLQSVASSLRHAPGDLGRGLAGLERRQRQPDRGQREPTPGRSGHPDARRDPEHPRRHPADHGQPDQPQPVPRHDLAVHRPRGRARRHHPAADQPPPTTPPPSGGTCTATATTPNVWGDRYNTSVTVSGASTWTVVVAITSPQRVSTIWNGTATWDSSGTVMTMRSNGSGNTFGFTTMTNGNSSARPQIRSCTSG